MRRAIRYVVAATIALAATTWVIATVPNVTAEVAVGLAAVWCAVLLAAIVVATAPARRSLVGRRLLTGAIVVLLVLEVGSRVDTSGSLSFMEWSPDLRMTFHPVPGLLPGIAYAESHFSTSPDGLRARARSPSDEVRILVVGGSTAESLYVDDPDAWSAVLEAELARATGKRVWVGNAGKSGLDSAHHVVLMRTLGAQLRPDVTVVLVGANEVTHRPQGIDWDRGMVQFQRVHDPPLIVDGAVHWSGLQVFWDARLVSQTLRLNVARRNELVQDEAGRFLAAARATRRNAVKADERPADFDAALAAYDARLRALVAAARADGTRLVVLTQPSLYRDPIGAAEREVLWSGAGGPDGRTFYSDRAMADMMATYNRRTLLVCEEEGVDRFDLASVVPQDLGSFYDDVHFNTAGSLFVGKTVASFLVREGIVTTRR